MKPVLKAEDIGNFGDVLAFTIFSAREISYEDKFNPNNQVRKVLLDLGNYVYFAHIDIINKYTAYKQVKTLQQLADKDIVFCVTYTKEAKEIVAIQIPIDFMVDFYKK